MRSVNKVILIGNVTRDPVYKTTANGQGVVLFGLATNRDWTTRSGERKTLTEFHNIVVWSRLAEKCAQFVKKGKLLYVEGYLKTRSFLLPDGKRSYRTEVVIYDMRMLDKRPQDDTKEYEEQDEELILSLDQASGEDIDDEIENL